jgi:hypothetical protein
VSINKRVSSFFGSRIKPVPWISFPNADVQPTTLSQCDCPSEKIFARQELSYGAFLALVFGDVKADQREILQVPNNVTPFFAELRVTAADLRRFAQGADYRPSQGSVILFVCAPLHFLPTGTPDAGLTSW